MRKKAIFLLLLGFLLLLSSCRVRTTLPYTVPPGAEAADPPEPEPETPPEPEQPEEPEPQPEPEPEPDEPEEPEQPDEPEQPPEEEPPVSEEPEPNAPEEEDSHREYAPDAGGELTPEAESPVYSETEEPAETSLGEEPAETGPAVNTEGENADLTVTETVSAQEAEQLGTSETGAVADSMLTYYLTLLDERVGDLFECKRLYIYWETQEDHRTVYKTSREHEIILGAGAYDVSARLLEENLTVDDGWVYRKNPDVIVKVVTGTPDALSLQTIRDALTGREAWDGIGAVKNGRILLVSQELLDTQAGRTAVMLYLAKGMYPEQLEDVDPAEALRSLTEEASGTPWLGTYAWWM